MDRDQASRRNLVLVTQPLVMPMGWRINKPEQIHAIWDAYIEEGKHTSVEARMLIAVLQSVHEGLALISRSGTCSTCTAQDSQNKEKE